MRSFVPATAPGLTSSFCTPKPPIIGDAGHRRGRVRQQCLPAGRRGGGRVGDVGIWKHWR
eukprot:7386802-Prymnesium_polylepis.1